MKEYTQAEYKYILSCLDSAKTSISIYDKNARLIFANKFFCDYLNISDRDKYIGKNINDIISEIGTTIHSIGTNTNKLKMFDVLNQGKEALDWEVRIETSNRKHAQLVSNDMYPVISENGNVNGLVEITHSRQQSLAQAKKVAGLSAEYTFSNIIGSSHAIKDVIHQAMDYANSPFSLLITGESGVGKELFAQSIHNYSSRCQGPFVALNCASFPESLIESELFGYVGGAFTGASKSGQMGKFELADGGTLFLDEIGELPFHFQSKLLRVLETWSITRLGGSKPILINVRLIAATNKNLAQMVEDGLFRQDLYYRLQVLNIIIPPLRERKEDIIHISEELLYQAKDPASNSNKILSQSAKDTLISYDWPGNVRELRNVLYRATLLSKSDVIENDVLEASLFANNPEFQGSKKTSEDASNLTNEERIINYKNEVINSEIKLINEALTISNGNKKKAAELLGISRNTFYRMLEKYSIR